MALNLREVSRFLIIFRFAYWRVYSFVEGIVLCFRIEWNIIDKESGK